jgi:hypothetical protein
MSNVVKVQKWEALKAAIHTVEDDVEIEVPLNHGGGGGTSGGMETVDAKIAAAEARTDTKFAELRGDLKSFATAKELRNAVWGAAAVVIATVLAAIAFGGDRFDAGLGMADVRQAQLQRDDKQDEALKSIEGKLDKLIEAQQAKPAPTQK